MPITKTPITLIATAFVDPGATKASPALSGARDCRNDQGAGLLTYSILNGSSAPGAPAMIQFQVSLDGVNWRDFWTAGGDIVANSVTTGTIDLPRAVMWVRAIVYGNTTNRVTVAVELHAVTAL